MSSIELISPLPPDECAARLREAIGRDGILSFFGSQPVIGRVSKRSVRLAKRMGGRNALQTILTGRFEPHGTGTVFRGRSGIHPFVRAFMAVWLICIGLVSGAIFVGALVSIGKVDGWLTGLLVPPLMFASGVGFVYFGRYCARGEEQFLTGFLVDLLHAENSTTKLSGPNGRDG